MWNKKGGNIMYIGQKVFIRDPFITDESMVPPCEVLEIKKNVCLVKLENGVKIYISKFTLKEK